MDGVVNGANEKHLRPWTELMKEHAIEHTPLTPFIDRALLGHNHMCVDGSEIERATGFAYEVPALMIGTLRPVVEQYVALGWFPPLLEGGAGAGGGGGGGGGGGTA